MFNVIDLFAGAGGLSLGFEETDKFKIKAFVENNQNATKTYKKNNKGAIHYPDILDLDFIKVRDKVGPIDLVIGGPPCQGFSNANRQRRKIINGSNELVKKYVEAISVLKPKMFVMENVKNIASAKHFFCLTTGDREHIENNLGIKIHKEKLLLYNRKDYLEEIYNSLDDYLSSELAIIEENQLYILKNMLKKGNDNSKIKKFIDKQSNKKNLRDVINTLNSQKKHPYWLKNLYNKSIEAIQRIIHSESILKDDEQTLNLFCDIERFYIGLTELENHRAIYDVKLNNNDITIILHAYVVIEYIRKSFNYLGYEIKGDVLNAANFCVPQCRERYIMMGVERGFLGDREIQLPEAIINNESDYITVRSAIEDLVNYKPGTGEMSTSFVRNPKTPSNKFLEELIYNGSNGNVYNHVSTDSGETAKERFKQIKQGDNFHSLPENLKKTYSDPGRTQNTIYRRLDYNSPSDTVVNVRKSMWIHPILDRAISAREAARLQSFPDYYEFVGTKDSVYQQIGNAVPPLLGRAIAEKVLDIFEPDIFHNELRKIYLQSILTNDEVQE